MSPPVKHVIKSFFPICCSIAVSWVPICRFVIALIGIFTIMLYDRAKSNVDNEDIDRLPASVVAKILTILLSRITMIIIILITMIVIIKIVIMKMVMKMLMRETTCQQSVAALARIL